MSGGITGPLVAVLLLLLLTPGSAAATVPDHPRPAEGTSGEPDESGIGRGRLEAVEGQRGTSTPPYGKGKRLFSEGRIDEALPLLEEQCRASLDEGACAAASAIYLSRADWPAAFDLAGVYERNACRSSEPLSAILLLGGPCALGREAGGAVVRLRPDHELSYLILASAHLRCGEPDSAREVIEKVLSRIRSRRLLTRLLEACRGPATETR